MGQSRGVTWDDIRPSPWAHRKETMAFDEPSTVRA